MTYKERVLGEKERHKREGSRKNGDLREMVATMDGAMSLG